MSTYKYILILYEVLFFMIGGFLELESVGDVEYVKMDWKNVEKEEKIQQNEEKIIEKLRKESAEENGRKLAEKNTEIENLKESLKTSKEGTRSERAKNQDLNEKLNSETTARKSDWLNWNAARAKEIKKMEET
ncbi:hypothetical protein CRE_08330 [Caenorhabditis remanei]|uniref:Uncharacterized protein n=1 Tax=Caenorhabditis remanei TaxID=31234 RepID=E3MPG0_CAERE|nr:hypothetical protein CRE_08330 [Caenorhabditis remanei]